MRADRLSRAHLVPTHADATAEITAVSVPDSVDVLGVRIANVVRGEAIALLRQLIELGRLRARAAYFVNTHTLNLAAEQPAYRAVLNRADVVLGDGTGVRWAARLQGIRMRANMCGTDIVPLLIATAAPARYRYFLLGARPEVVAGAAAYLRRVFPELHLAGCQHGHFAPADGAGVVHAINQARPHVLLVAMGNPLQEQWIDAHLAELRGGLCIGVGGLFDHWAGVLRRAPEWVRAAGMEWTQLLLQQPSKWRRYLLGNPRFLWRVGRLSSVAGQSSVVSRQSSAGGRESAVGGLHLTDDRRPTTDDPRSAS